MEQQQRSLVFTAAVGLIILAIIVGSIYYLVKFIQTRVSSSRQTPQASVEVVAEASALPTEAKNIQDSQVIPDPSITQPIQQGSIQSGAAISRTSPAVQTAETKGGVVVSGEWKIFDTGNFKLSYPKSWGLLTCANSNNLELDPKNSADSKTVCNYSVKPITVLVEDVSGCAGEVVNIGNIAVTKSKQGDSGYTKYQWCTKTAPVLNITHRVSTGNDPASLREDYSKQIEEMIGKLTFTR